MVRPAVVLVMGATAVPAAGGARARRHIMCRCALLAQLLQTRGATAYLGKCPSPTGLLSGMQSVACSGQLPKGPRLCCALNIPGMWREFLDQIGADRAFLETESTIGVHQSCPSFIISELGPSLAGCDVRRLN